MSVPRLLHSFRLKRFLIAAPACQPWDLGGYLERLFRAAGLQSTTWAYGACSSRQEADRALLKAVDAASPDVLLGLKLDRISAAALRQARKSGVFLSLWYVDCFIEDIPSWIVPLVKEADLFLTTAKGMLPKYRALGGAPVHWLYEGAYLPAFPRLRLSASARSTYGAEVAFVGNVFQPPVPDRRLALRRWHLLGRLSERFDVKIWGPQGGGLSPRDLKLPRCQIVRWPAYNAELVKVCQASAIVLGMNTVNTVELYFSNRTFLTLASGGFHLTEYVPGLETLFGNHRHLVWYESEDECADLCQYYLRRPAARQRIAAAGRQLVRRRFGMKRQFTRLLQLIEEERGRAGKEASS